MKLMDMQVSGSVARVRVTVHFTTDDPNATATVTVKYKLYKEIKPKNKPPEFANFLIYFETIDRGFNAPDITYEQKDPLLKPLTASCICFKSNYSINFRFHCSIII
jgi:hypothetical protein